MMNGNILDGLSLARALEAPLQQKVRKLTSRPPHLTAILVGDNPSSKIYIQKKQEALERVGMEFTLLKIPEDTSQSSLLQILTTLNTLDRTDAILVQFPLPPHLDTCAISQHLAPEKDVDGIHPLNLGKLLMGEQGGLVACTPLGIKMLLDHYAIPISHQHVVVYGRSNIVGKPMAAMLSQIEQGYDATVTIAHRDSPCLYDMTRAADILIVAAGKPHAIGSEHIRHGCVVIDVGIHRMGPEIVGDVFYSQVAPKTSWITPVPGGVGPMTIAALLENTWKCYEVQHL